MYPATIFEYVDESQIEKINISNSTVKPVFMFGFTSDKGPEDYRMVEGEDFFKMYGNDISFTRHGQPLLQAAMAINAGGRVFAKRVVDPTATIANGTLYADVSSVQKEDGEGNKLYTDADSGEETTTADGNTPIMITNIKYAIQSVASQTSHDNAANAAYSSVSTLSTEGHNYYPLYTITDIGRGVSKKKWQIQPDYKTSKSLDYVAYVINVYESNIKLESIQFAFNPETVEGNKNVSAGNMIKNNSVQIAITQYDSDIKNFVDKVSELSGISEEELYASDILFACTNKAVPLGNIVIDDSGVNLTTLGGLPLNNGNNGTFGNAPILSANSDIYATELAKVWNGEFDNCIYDVDNYKIDLIIDANYPPKVKTAIANYVTFREDCMYLRDMGIDKRTIDQVKAALTDGTSGFTTRNKFTGDYLTSYDVIDPYSKKQITVSIGYTLTKLMVQHFIGGRSRPLAGMLNDFIIGDAIKGTVNIIPVITPSVNQKEELEDLKINYASYYDDNLIVESLYTGNEKFSEFSFINNILAIQEVIKAVRSYCPKIRYSFISGDDLEKYKADVQKVLDRYTNNFMSMSLEYITDTVYISNRIFYAAIKVRFKKFVQTEYFKVVSLPAE